jgi:hypothetical protein
MSFELRRFASKHVRKKDKDGTEYIYSPGLGRYVEVESVPEPPGVRAKQHRWRENFIIVPGLWKERLTKVQHIATYRVALHILMRNFETHGEPFTLSNGALTLENVGRGTKWRALKELEQFDLITVQRRTRKSPQITALHTDSRRRK